MIDIITHKFVLFIEGSHIHVVVSTNIRMWSGYLFRANNGNEWLKANRIGTAFSFTSAMDKPHRDQLWEAVRLEILALTKQVSNKSRFIVILEEEDVQSNS